MEQSTEVSPLRFSGAAYQERSNFTGAGWFRPLREKTPLVPGAPTGLKEPVQEIDREPLPRGSANCEEKPSRGEAEGLRGTPRGHVDQGARERPGTEALVGLTSMRELCSECSVSWRPRALRCCLSEWSPGLWRCRRTARGRDQLRDGGHELSEDEWLSQHEAVGNAIGSPSIRAVPARIDNW